MRFHVVGLPHTQTNGTHCSCAFTTKTYRFCKMMSRLGHQVFHYGAEGSDLKDYAEEVTILSATEQQALCGDNPHNQLYDVDWTGKTPIWPVFNVRAADAIVARKQAGDFVCVIGGKNNQLLADLVGKDVAVVEFGIGYDGVFAKYRVYDSYAHMHKILGAEHGYGPDGDFYHVAIPNGFDLSEYPYYDQSQSGNYFLYLGRLIKRKGIHIAVETCKRLNAKLVIAGAGVKEYNDHRLTATDGEVYEYENLEYVGFADQAKRADLLGKAIATFYPTLYVEPGGYVAVESQLTGTPAITTDWGFFT